MQFAKYRAAGFCGIALLFIAGAVSCARNDKSSEEAAMSRSEELPVVRTDVVHATDVPQIKSYTATIEADNLNNIAPAAPNRIKTIAVEVGDRVRRGQPLVTLDSSTSDQLRINLEQIEREYNRAVELKNIGAGTQQAVDQLKAQLDAARSQLANAMENTVLVSPISGVVTARNYDPGDMTGSMPVLTVGQLSPSVKVIINVSETDLALVRRGMPVKVTFDAFEGQQFNGSITRIHPTVDPATRTFKVEVSIANPGEKILPGMFGRVEFNLGSSRNVVVPDRAVVKQSGSGNKYVYVLHDGDRVSYNRVELGQRIDDSYELLSGVADGDTVVVSGQSRLADGVKVEVMK